MRRGRATRLAAVAVVALAWAAQTAAAEGDGGAHLGTWLNWLSSVRVGGHLVVTDAARLAFAWSVVAVLVLATVAVVGTRRLSLKPKGLQTVLELIVGALRGLVVGVMGPRGVDFVPFIGSLFIYIVVMNMMGLVPGSMSPTSNLSITAGLALVVFVVVQYYGVRERGVRYLEHFVEGVPLQFPYIVLAPMVFLIHLVGELFRPVTLALRLFGNIMAEETVFLILIGLVVGLARHYIVVPIQLPNMALGIITSTVQGLIFAMLATVYLSGVVHAGAEEEH